MLPVPLVVAAVAAASSVMTFAVAIVGATGTDTAYLTGSTAGVAMGGYVYLVKKFLDGDLIAKHTSELVAGAEKREERLTDLVEDYKERVDLHEAQYRVRFDEYKEREDDLRALIMASHAAIGALTRENKK